MYFEIYQVPAGLLNASLGASIQWRWRLKSANHETIASGEGYNNKQDCLHAIDLVKSTNQSTPIHERSSTGNALAEAIRNYQPPKL